MRLHGTICLSRWDTCSSKHRTSSDVSPNIVNQRYVRNIFSNRTTQQRNPHSQPTLAPSLAPDSDLWMEDMSMFRDKSDM
jgi:hypothetical protein